MPLPRLTGIPGRYPCEARNRRQTTRRLGHRHAYPLRTLPSTYPTSFASIGRSRRGCFTFGSFSNDTDLGDPNPVTCRLCPDPSKCIPHGVNSKNNDPMSKARGLDNYEQAVHDLLHALSVAGNPRVSEADRREAHHWATSAALQARQAALAIYQAESEGMDAEPTAPWAPPHPGLRQPTSMPLRLP